MSPTFNCGKVKVVVMGPDSILIRSGEALSLKKSEPEVLSRVKLAVPEAEVVNGYDLIRDLDELRTSKAPVIASEERPSKSIVNVEPELQ
jgi:hypothetical protein